MRCRLRADGGVVTTQLVIATPALLTLLMLVVQLGLWLHASHVVHAAAQEGARVARAETGTDAAGRARATQLLDGLAGELLTDRTVTATRDGLTARVEITGHVIPVVPALRVPVRAVSHGPIERFSSP
jgi:Flp pilus assembly protein TadG